jgi:adhesin transport system outer membrane protein
VVKKAVVSNPEVQARWHAFLASRHEQDVVRGRYLPQVDFTSSLGREYLNPAASASTSLTAGAAELTLNQMIYDGFATRSEVAKMAYAKLVRYYEVLDASETTALEATQAYLDVLRQRELTLLVQENLYQHEQVFKQLQERYKAGVGRGVDLEQAGGRLALAHSNVLTEASNLHDVTARFLRIVGELPADELQAPKLLEQGLPVSVEDAVRLAFQGSPAFKAAIENVRSAQADVRSRQSGLHPRLDLRASQSFSQDAEGTKGRRDDQTIGVVLSYNLYRGGSDEAQVRQYGERLESAREQRDTTCRNIRQTVTIAFNDIHSLSRQIGFLDQHQLAIEKAREAYRQQFDIGQRSLLDLLNTENEYFTARRSYVNAIYNHAIAYARTQAGMGKLLSVLDIGREGMPSAQDVGQDRPDVDPADQCPAAVPLTGASSTPPPAPIDMTPPPRPVPVTPPPSAEQLAPAPQSRAYAHETVHEALTEWVAAWSAKDYPRYRAHYVKSFTPENGQTLEKWEAERAASLGIPGDIMLGISNLKTSTLGPDKAITEFRQTYASSTYRGATTLRLEWIREGNRWKIQREQVLDVPAGGAPKKPS